MRIIADLHIHSPYARAVSKDMTLENLDTWAQRKGITVMGTGDFTHPQWMKEIKSQLIPAEQGLYQLKRKSKGTRFLLTVEVSSIYSKGGKTRRVHNLVFAPSIESAEKINKILGVMGNIRSDGRPILGLDSKELARIVFDIDPRCMLVPAHAWTPWFSVFGSMSGFDSLEECFEEYAPYIYAIETGLSSDPEMNWRVKGLDHIALISNSDSHSLKRIGREANVLDCKLSYNGIMDAIKSHDPKQFLFTVEFFPEEGKYHYDGHRACKFSCTPDETKKLGNKCPVCKRKMTIGVMNRVDVIADRALGKKSPFAIPFKRMVPLDEIIAESFGMGTASKKVKIVYDDMIKSLGTEFGILIDAELSDIAAAATPEIVEGIKRVREGNLQILPGYDGEYGVVKIFDSHERVGKSAHSGLFI
ncbi:MAG: endonuclease Q family protein [bacterium]|nr:endonuclease Q family protein [bacterium]MDZ4286265.1 endonuclease Q family protein [Candidatus Sungbacteria bacterium]